MNLAPAAERTLALAPVRAPRPPPAEALLARMIDPLSEVLGGLLVASCALKTSTEVSSSRRAEEAAQAVTGAMAGARQLAAMMVELRGVIAAQQGRS